MLHNIPAGTYGLPSNWLSAALAIFGGLLLDAILGDPQCRWHPVRLLGLLAAKAETLCRKMFRTAKARSQQLLAAGACAWLLVAGTAAAGAFLVSLYAHWLHPLAGLAADILIIWASIAPADLARHALRVRRALHQDSTAMDGLLHPRNGRAAVAMIVGRDVSKLDSAGCCRAAIESVAESSIDGAAAPLFWAAILGPWGAFLYRAINTMDSIYGHKNQRYRWFGFAAAKMDDFFNLIPARLSSLLAVLLAPAVNGSTTNGLHVLIKERRHHDSPNAGHPEAAYAGILNIRLGGPTFYAEGLLEKPWFNESGRECRPEDIVRSIRLMFLQTGCSALLFVVLRLVLPW